MFEKTSVNRRQFLKQTGLLSVAAAAAAAAPLSEVLAFDRELTKVTRSTEAMSTYVTITVLAPSVAQADDAIEKAFAEMKRVTKLMDRFDSASPVSVLNRDGALSGLPEEVADVLARSNYFHTLSRGEFDITVKPVVDLYQQSFSKAGQPPSDRDLQKAMELVNGNGVLVNGRDARLAKPGMGVTLDGIAKGYIIDVGAATLRRQGIQHLLVDAGGDIRAIGGKEQGRGWTIAVRNPDGPNYADKITMTDGAVATSGNYEVYFDREKLFHHIINPQTGVSPYQATSVSVAAPNTTQADALSTAVFVMGAKRGKEFVDTVPGTECLVITRDGRKTATDGWKKMA
ncbi:MAG: FAD:protein FMN transferase [Thermodesulfobacteriota bacterium]